jgi:hypothetical protein
VLTQEDCGAYPCKHFWASSFATLLLHGVPTVARRESATPVKITEKMRFCEGCGIPCMRLYKPAIFFLWLNFVTFLVGGWEGAEVSMVFGSSTQRMARCSGICGGSATASPTFAGSSMQLSKVQRSAVAVPLLLQRCLQSQACRSGVWWQCRCFSNVVCSLKHAAFQGVAGCSGSTAASPTFVVILFVPH